MDTHQPRDPGRGESQLIDRQGFWSLVVATPVLLAVLRLWAEAGGDLQTTLLLVANVGAVNLFAALVVHAAWLVSAVLVTIFAIGGITDPYHAAPPEVRGGQAAKPPLFCWLSGHAPLWLKLSVFALAALTWKLLYAPLLILAFFATFRDQLPQTAPPPSSSREPTSPRRIQLLQLVSLAGYVALFGPTVVQAAEQRYVVPVMLIVGAPVLLMLGAYHPVPARLARPFAAVTQTGTIAFALIAGTPVIAAPVLPLSVVTVEGPDGPEPVRGHVVEVNDNTTAILRENGGVEFIANSDVEARILCPDRDQAPQYRLWIHGIHVEDNLLQGIGRNRHPRVTIDPRCRPAVPEHEVDEG